MIDLIEILLIDDRHLDFRLGLDDQREVLRLRHLLVEGLDHVVAGLGEAESPDPQHGLRPLVQEGGDLVVLVHDGVYSSAGGVVPETGSNNVELEPWWCSSCVLVVVKLCSRPRGIRFNSRSTQTVSWVSIIFT